MTKKYACSWMTVTGSVAHIDDSHDSRDHFFMKKNVAGNGNDDNDNCDESSYKTKRC